jgi:integrase
MSDLCTRMDNDMLVRGMAERTREAYLAAVARLARHYHRSPDQLSPAEVQAYLVHMLREEHLAWSTCNIAVQAFRFLSRTTLGRPDPTFTIPGPRRRKTLPEILSPAEVRHLLEATTTRKQRVLLATTYAAGLRVSEVVRLRLQDIDAERMSLRVEQGKGARIATRSSRPACWRSCGPTGASAGRPCGCSRPGTASGRWTPQRPRSSTMRPRDGPGSRSGAVSTRCATPSPRTS